MIETITKTVTKIDIKKRTLCKSSVAARVSVSSVKALKFVFLNMVTIRITKPLELMSQIVIKCLSLTLFFFIQRNFSYFLTCDSSNLCQGSFQSRFYVQCPQNESVCRIFATSSKFLGVQLRVRLKVELKVLTPISHCLIL